MITKLSLWLAILFYTPSIFISIVYIFIGSFLLKSAVEKYGYHGGYRSKIGLKLLARGYKIQDDVSFDTLSYATQIKEKEIIMKAIRADKAYPFIAKEDRKKTVKDADKTIFNVKFLSPQQSASLGDQIFDVRGAGSSSQIAEFARGQSEPDEGESEG